MMKPIYDIESAADWCETVIGFLQKVEPKHPLYGQFLEVVRATAKSGNRTAMKSIARDIREWTEALSPHDRDELNSLLASKFSKSPENEGSSDRVVAARVAMRGKIKDLGEYEILERRAEELFQQNPESPELESINRLLAAFHTRL